MFLKSKIFCLKQNVRGKLFLFYIITIKYIYTHMFLFSFYEFCLTFFK